MLDLIESFSVLKAFHLAKFYTIESEDELSRLEFPYWIKASIPEHKLEKKAVLKCNNLDEAGRNLRDLRKRFPSNKIIIQEDIKGREMIIGIKEDRVFGKLLMIGFGGTTAEITRDVSFRALPLDRKEIEKQLRELRLYKSIENQPALNKFISLAEKLSKLDVSEADFNPVILTEKDAVIVDVRIEK